jgi:hypothetical protein
MERPSVSVCARTRTTGGQPQTLRLRERNDAQVLVLEGEADDEVMEEKSLYPD